MKTILILGQQNNAEVQSVAHKASLANCHTIILDSRDIPDKVSLEYYPQQGATQLVINGASFPLSAIDGIYWSRVDPPNTQSIKDKEAAANANLESSCLLQILLSEENLNWVNSFQAVQFHRTKPRQLTLAQKLGATIPATYIGNRPSAIQSFLRQHPNAISKPVFAGELTQVVQAHMQSQTSIEQWAKLPITLQAFVPGENIRTYIAGDFMVSALIQESYKHKNSLRDNPEIAYSDYRHADQITLIPMQIPIAIQQLAVRIMRAFHMQFTAIDWRLTPQGEFVFLEANPAPLFVNAQKQLGVEIDQAIVSLLLN
jgi:glutathione synthase/RimK-type ligase-like ATP-grasp enzyme